MKDFYRILQLESDASAEEVNAAYRRLIKEHHPDSLDPDERDDPAVLHRVQQLNAAYEVLGDETARSQYDEEFRWYKRQAWSGQSAYEEMERLEYLVRCGKSKQTHKMHLIRPAGAGGPYRVIGFEPLPDIPQLVHSVANRKSLRERLADFFGGSTTKQSAQSQSDTKASLAPDDELQQLLDGATALNMGDIDWGFHDCPDCHSIVENPNGTIATWIGCSKCGHIKCVGSVERTGRGISSECPWCGKRNRVTRSVPVGQKDHLSLKGRSTSAVERDSQRIKGETGGRLDDGEE